jgi:hypothetical protein
MMGWMSIWMPLGLVVGRLLATGEISPEEYFEREAALRQSDPLRP